MKYTGWLSPQGDLISCEGYAHMDRADEIARILNVFNREKQSDETLLKLGWIRISRITYGDEGLMFWMPDFITSNQYDFLRNIAFEKNIDISKRGYETLIAYHIFE